MRSMVEGVGSAASKALVKIVSHRAAPSGTGTTSPSREMGRRLIQLPARQLSANFSTLIASKSCTPPPTRLVV